EICKVWSGASRHIRKQLLQKRVVEMGVGTFAVVPASATVGDGRVLPVERLAFQPCRSLKKFYKLKCAERNLLGKTQSVPLDFAEIAASIHFCPEIVEQCIHETLLFFAEALRDDKEVELLFQ
ncbi:CCD81 protein, partial [Hemiprocne comata]|nr:CCD81 protein [Hemiprocne comata]NXG67792.1 CCD81 protein [Hemiprocne comata]